MAKNNAPARGGHGPGPGRHGFQRPKNTKKTFLRLLGYVKPYMANLIIVMICIVITAFAQKIAEPDERENPNQIQLTGTLCKAPAYRTTPFGREIADMMLAVNRAYGKSDYIPCITWGRSARFAAKLNVGDKITLTGRLQSRGYQKQLADGTVVEKTAYEVSVGHLELLSDGPEGLTEPVMQADFRSAAMTQ